MTDEPILSTKDRVGEYDALETAKPGEPILVLQGGDPFAPPTILHWVKLFRSFALDEPNDEKREAMLRKATAAEAVAWAMLAYQRGEASAPKPEAPPTEVVTESAAILARGADRLYNFEAELLGIADHLAALGGHTKAVGRIREAASTAKSAARLFEPRRHLQGERADG